MDFLRYITRFLFRIRWYLVTLPVIAGIIAWLCTRDLPKLFNVETTIYTGLVSGYNIEGGAIASNSSVNMANLLLIISTEKTVKRVGLRLLARVLMYGDREHDNNYISAQHFNEFIENVPADVKALVDKRSERRTVDNLTAYAQPTGNNYVYNLLLRHHYFGAVTIAAKLKVVHVNKSDMIQIGYSSDDAGIAYNTLELLNEEFIDQYQVIRYGETHNVIKFFEQEVTRLYRILCGAEDDLIAYNVSKRVINYAEQTKMVANLDAAHKTRENDQLLRYMSNKAVGNYLSEQLGDRTDRIRNNSEFISQMQNIAKLTSRKSNLELMNSEDEHVQSEINRTQKMIEESEESIKELTMRLARTTANLEGVDADLLLTQWLSSELELEKTQAEMEANNIMRDKLDDDFLYFSPIGATLGRKERHIGFIEGNYMEMLKALNAARLRQRNLQMSTATLRVLNPPMFPLNSAPSNRWMYVIGAMLLTFLLTALYFFLIEMLDHTLRDRRRAEKLTGCRVLSCYPQDSTLRYRRYNKVIADMAMRHISKQLLPYVVPDRVNIFNLLSTSEGNGKSTIGTQLEDLWTSMGLQVRRLTYDEDFLTDDRSYLMAKSVNDFCSDLKPGEIVLVEYPGLCESPVPTALLREAVLNLMVTRANRTWKDIDQKALDVVTEDLGGMEKLRFILTETGRAALEEYVGQLPPYTSFQNFVYRMSQLGLTATENTVTAI